MIKKIKTQEEETNYSFLLKCMAALAATAATAAIIGAVLIKTSALIAAVAATNMMFASTALVFMPLLSIIPIALAFIGLACILPCLFNGNSTHVVRDSNYVVRTGVPNYFPVYAGVRNNATPIRVYETGSIHGHFSRQENHHGHGNPGSSVPGQRNHHGHAGGAFPGNQHGHGFRR